MNFQLKSKFKPAGDQPKAISQLVEGLKRGDKHQTLLGVTGSGKTFTVANVIAQIQKPTLVISHNKTLAAQLCNEFREFFPDSAVEYFVSYYDYYQPEAYLPTSDTYIDKEAMINEEIDRLRHAATQALLTRRDVIIVASVSCIYGLGSPESYEAGSLRLTAGQYLNRRELARQLVEMQFNRTTSAVKRGEFRLVGEVMEVMPVNQELLYRLDFRAGALNEILLIDPLTRKTKASAKECWFFPAKHYVITPKAKARALQAIRQELQERLAYFKKHELPLEAERLTRRTRYDLELIEEIGYCHGIENYSRHFDGRPAGAPPYTLLDYFKNTGDYLMIIDESHVSVPQLGGMYQGDASRKRTLIEHGFRLPSAADNRPLKFDEFSERLDQVIYTSATPADYELKLASQAPPHFSRGAGGVWQRKPPGGFAFSDQISDGFAGNGAGQVVEQIIRPTGLVDPEVVVQPVTGQVEDLIKRIKERSKRKELTLATVLTKKMAEDLAEYLENKKIKAKYLHSDIDTLERLQILGDFRRGLFQVLVGVNLLREGLDLPEVSLVAILDADKEGFLRNATSLIQTTGRAARHVRGQAVFYADHITGSLKKAIDETNRRREIQIEYNKQQGITPRSIKKPVTNILEEFNLHPRPTRREEGEVRGTRELDLELEIKSSGKPVEQMIKEKEKQMRQAAKQLEFELAALLRDEIRELKRRS